MTRKQVTLAVILALFLAVLIVPYLYSKILYPALHPTAASNAS